ncbi:MAG: hypothetical protein WAK03_14425 [Methylocystis sp.]|jgi:hypothetical protein
MTVIESKNLMAPQGQKLASLDESELRERFYSWRGASGRRYVCSIFSVADQEMIAGFSGAAVIGVANAAGTRRAVCVMSSNHISSPQITEISASSLGVDEWHVHFRAGEAELRDLAGSLLN